MQCPRCSHPINAQSRFCAHCGAGLLQTSTGKILRGKYTIHHSLAKGGMGAIYLASETIAGQQRLLAVKEMLAYYDTSDPQAEERARKRFEAEAATLAALSIAGVPQIFDYFTEGGSYYIVMQFIEGENLESKLTHEDDSGNQISGQAYPEDQVRQWGVKICRILEVLAAKNIIHMDIKPANLILDKSGDIWLVDFGTVKAQIPVSPGGQFSGHKPSIYGTAGYAPPEQGKGQAEPRSDVYALAATLYHLMTDDDPGDTPFQFPELNKLTPEVGKALKKALNADVNQRLSAAAFRAMLETRSSSRPVFRWQDGTVSYHPKDLVLTANRKWDEALGYFQADDWVKWFKDLYKNDLAAELLAIKKRHVKPELALDAFLRHIEPALPPAALHLPSFTLDAGVVPWQTRRDLDIKIFNRGSGCLQARFVNLAPGVQVAPNEFTVHEEQSVKVCLDTGVLTPAASRQRHYLEIDAGTAGKAQLEISTFIPEPGLTVDPTELDLGAVYRGQLITNQIKVHNPGKSPFTGEVRCIAPWARVKPSKLSCRAGASDLVKVEVDTREMKMETHAALVDVWARAGKWEQLAQVRLTVRVSLLKTLVHILAPPLKWVGAWSLYGICMGAALGTSLGRIAKENTELSTWLLFAALFGAVISALPGLLIGWFGGIGEMRGREGAWRLAAYGSLVGVLLGGLSGTLLQPISAGAAFNLGAGVGFPLFSALVGWLVGMSLGAILWFLPKK